MNIDFEILVSARAFVQGKKKTSHHFVESEYPVEVNDMVQSPLV
jgi:hypothetical protein